MLPLKLKQGKLKFLQQNSIKLCELCHKNAQPRSTEISMPGYVGSDSVTFSVVNPNSNNKTGKFYERPRSSRVFFRRSKFKIGMRGISPL